MIYLNYRYVFLFRRKDGLVDGAVKTPVGPRGEFVATTVAAHADNEGVVPGEVMARRQRANGGEAPVVLERHFPLEYRHAVGQAKAAGGHAAHHAVVDDLPGGGVGGGLKVEDNFVVSSGRVHGEEQGEGDWNPPPAAGG